MSMVYFYVYLHFISCPSLEFNSFPYKALTCLLNSFHISWHVFLLNCYLIFMIFSLIVAPIGDSYLFLYVDLILGNLTELSY